MAGEESRNPREIYVPVTGYTQSSSEEKVGQEFNSGQEDQDGAV